MRTTQDTLTPIAAKALTHPNDVALSDGGTILTWVQLNDCVNRCANALRAAGLPEGARIATFSHNSVETIVVYLAAFRAGISSVPLSFHLTAEEIATLLKASHSEMLFVGGETPAGIEGARLAGVGSVIGWRCAASAQITDWREWLSAAATEEPPFDMPPRRQLHYTSGTTGSPKGLETPPTMFPETASVGELFRYFGEMANAPSGHSPALMLGPHYHSAGLRQMRFVAGGVPLFILPRFEPEQALRLIDRHKIGMTTMVPTHFQRLLALPREVRAKYDVSSLRAVFHTGSACPLLVKREMIDWFGPILIEAYGGTEAGTVTTINSQEWLQRPGSVGRAVAPFEILILDDAGAPCAPNETGSVYFRDNTGRGIVYHGNPELTKSAHIAPGIFTLGEVGHVDEEGYLFITDRASDMIVSGGVNIYPIEIEHVLAQHPEVADVAVIGAPNAEMGEEVKALIVPRDPANPPCRERLAEFTRARIAGLKCPRSFEFVPELGRNAMGKLNKRALRRPYWPSDRTIGG